MANDAEEPVDEDPTEPKTLTRGSAGDHQSTRQQLRRAGGPAGQSRAGARAARQRHWRRLLLRATPAAWTRRSLVGRHPLKLMASPDDPVTGDKDRGQQLVDGFFRCGSDQAELPETSDPFTALPEAGVLGGYIHGFTWLRDLAQLSDQSHARLVAERLTRGWVDRYGQWHHRLWQTDMLAGRITLWMLHAALILSSSDMVYRSSVLGSLARQARLLSLRVLDGADGPDRIRALTALGLAGLLLPRNEAWLEQAERMLDRELERLIAIDGGAWSRRPDDAEAILNHLLLLRSGYEERHFAPPPFLQLAIDRIGPFLAALCHGDGRLAQMNGAYSGRRDAQSWALSYAAGMPPRENINHTGFQRLSAGERRRVSLIVDTGPPPDRSVERSLHAGTLAFEMCDGDQRLFVNMGGSRPSPTPGEAALGEAVSDAEALRLEALMRTTAAHCTLTLADTNSSEIIPGGGLGNGVGCVEMIRRNSGDAILLLANHDGYAARYGLIHERQWTLFQNGRALHGLDLLRPAADGDKIAPARPASNPLDAVVRFHLHPDYEPVASHDGRSVVLRPRHAYAAPWVFKAETGTVRLEESLYVSAPGYHRASMQIAVGDEVGSDGLSISWSVARIE